LKYNDVIEGIFLNRPNRFIAEVLIDNNVERVHVKNTGRCKEILVYGTKVYLEKSNNANRKTKFSIISAFKENTLINIDSQAPNKVVYEAIKSGKIDEFKDITYIRREVVFDKSRFDLYYERGKKKGFIEIKGVTLEKDKLALFPDAPTERGAQHVEEMIKAKKEGLEGFIFFLIQMENISIFTPNYLMDKKFGENVKRAKSCGVNIIGYNSIVTKNEIKIGKKIKILV